MLLLGFKTTIVKYERNKRGNGKSKYTLSKMWAFDGILSFSVRQIRTITICRISISFFSFIYLIYVVLCRLITNNVEPGWRIIITLIYFFSVVQILCISIIGEYIVKIYSETKGRTRYIIDKETIN